MIQYFGTWLIAIAAVYPVAIRIAEMGSKPVDLVLSDFLFLFVLLTPPRKLLTIPEGTDLKKLAAIRVSAVVCICYSLGLSLVGYAASTEVGRVVSAAKYVKPITFVLLGAYLSMIFPPLLLLRRMATVFALIALATMGTALANPAFPRCGWGQYLFGWETYGYPNAPMTFYGFMVPLLAAAADLQRGKTMKLIYRLATVSAILLVVASLSRSSTIAMTVGLSVYLFVTGRGYIPVATVVAGALFAVAGAGLMRLETNIDTIDHLQHAVDSRLSQTLDGEDPLSGRGNIWMHVLELCSRKPIFGYAFEPFSRYSSIYDTTHQQYLEFLYKTGLVGSIFYMAILGSALIGLWHMLRCAEPHTQPYYLLNALLGGYLGVLVGNMSQPNLNYSLTGNTLFLMLGMILTRHGAAALASSPPRVRPTAATRSRSEVRNRMLPEAKAA